MSRECTLAALETVNMSDVELGEDSVALRSTLEFLRRHELLESERILVKELSTRIGDVDLESVAGGAKTSSNERNGGCLLYTSPSPRDQRGSRMPSSA